MTDDTPDIVERIKVGIRAALRDEFLSLSKLLGLMGELEPTLDAAQTRQLTLRIVHELLDGGRVVAGFPAPDGIEFDAWNLDTDQALQRIEATWDELGREPNMGEIVWFDAYDPASELLDLVSDRDSFFSFVLALIADRRDEVSQEHVKPSSPWGSGANGWEHSAIEEYLDAALSRAESGSEEELGDFPEAPSWKAFAHFLYWGKVYE